MPKPFEFMQEPMVLYPVVEQLDATKGVNTTLVDMPHVNPKRRITLGKLASLHGRLLGHTEGADENGDIILQVNAGDLERATPEYVENGLYIHVRDTRFRDPLTEQLITIGAIKGYTRDEDIPGVVVPAETYNKIPRNARALAKSKMAATRNANALNPDPIDVDGRVGRTPIHMLEETYIINLNKLENELLELRQEILIPLFRDVNGPAWQAHFKPSNLDKKRKVFDELIHDVFDTAVLNLDISHTQVKALHRADISKRYRQDTVREANLHWSAGILLVGNYYKNQRRVFDIARAACQRQLAAHEDFRTTPVPASGA